MRSIVSIVLPIILAASISGLMFTATLETMLRMGILLLHVRIEFAIAT